MNHVVDLSTIVGLWHYNPWLAALLAVVFFSTAMFIFALMRWCEDSGGMMLSVMLSALATVFIVPVFFILIAGAILTGIMIALISYFRFFYNVANRPH